MKQRLLTEEVERSEYKLFIWTHIRVFVKYLQNMVKRTGLVEWRRWRQWISHSGQIFLSLCALAPPYGQRDKEVVQRSLGEEDTRARWILRRRCDGDASFDALATSQKSLTTRVRRDPGTRPVPNFFSSTRPVPTRKLKMTGYRVIKFHFESNKTQPRMRNSAYKETNPINLSTLCDVHFIN